MLYVDRLVAGGEFFTDWEVPEMEHRRPFHYGVVEGKPFVLTSVENRISIQIQLLITLLKRGCQCQLWVLEDFWTQLGILIGNLVSTSDINWSHDNMNLSCYSIY